MAETRTYQGQTYQRNAPGEPWVLVGPEQPAPSEQRALVLRDPYRDAEEERKAAEDRRRQEDQELQRRQFELQRQQAEVNAALAGLKLQEGEIGLQDTLQGKQTEETKRTAKSISDRMKYGNILESIRAARAIARQGGTGWSSLLKDLPANQARALENAISPIKGNLAFDRLSEMRQDPDNQTGGALGNVTERELDLLASVVASLDTGVSREQFLANLDRIERHFVGAQLAMAGIDPYTEEGTEYFKQFGVALPEQKLEQAGIGATTQGRPIPPEMQAEHQALLEGWLQSPDPDTYAAMRADLDRKYGFEPDYARYRSWAADVAIPALNEGGTLGQALPPAEEPLQGLDWLLNSATAEPTGVGAFVAGMGNAGGLGIPTVLAGQDRMEALRGQSPTASLLGEIAGGITGALTTGAALGAGSRALGGGRIAELLANPITADTAYGGIYGATQADSPIEGAAVGAGAGWLGNKVGGAIARELPGLVGLGGAVRRADEAVPTVPQLRQQANELYTQAEATGRAVGPDATNEIFDSIQNTLAGEGQITPKGRVADAYPKVKTAFNLLEDYAGADMTPDQVQTVRRAIADAAGSLDPSERRIGTMMLRDFDERVEPFVPGLSEARSVASRYLNAEDIQQAIDLADPRSAQYSQSGLENALRTEFRALDRNTIRGTDRFPEEVVSAVQDVSRGTPVSNVARALGRFSPRGPVSTGIGAGVPFYVGNAMGGPAVGAGLAAITMGAGKLGQKVSEGLSRRQATVAELLARGGPEYAAALDEITNQAAIRGGHLGAGSMSPVAIALLETMGN